jgi:HlyD family secretion protein
MQNLAISEKAGLGVRWLMLGAITVCGGMATLTTTAEIVAVAPLKTVTALGRLEPVGEVVKLSAPTSNQGNRVEQLLVQEGDRLKKGQVVAILDAYPRLKAALEQADQQVKVAQAQLAVVKAGAKQGEIAAQNAEIARIEAQYQGDIATQSAAVRRLQAEVQNAQAEYERYQSLFDAGAISASQRYSKGLILSTAQSSLQEA